MTDKSVILTPYPGTGPIPWPRYGSAYSRPYLEVFNDKKVRHKFWSSTTPDRGSNLPCNRGVACYGRLSCRCCSIGGSSCHSRVGRCIVGLLGLREGRLEQGCCGLKRNNGSIANEKWVVEEQRRQAQNRKQSCTNSNLRIRVAAQRRSTGEHWVSLLLQLNLHQ